MPYVPPPRPPPAPRPPEFRPPPVFRPPPGPSVHQQQMIRQQQQIRQFHQTQQQLRANQNRMQMDRNRQQQMLRQQQLQRQQEENFRRQQQLQQDNQHRQQQLQQDQIRRQHQLHQNQQDQLRRQQQLLQGLQGNEGTSASSSVFISPAFTFEISGLGFGQATAEEGGGFMSGDSEGFTANFDGLPQGTFPAGQPSLSAPPPISQPSQQATPSSQAPPTDQQGSAYLPPYPGPPVSVPAQSLPPQPQDLSQAQSLPPKLESSLPHQFNSGPLAPQANGNLSPKSPPNNISIPPGPNLSRPPNNHIVLKDGTHIVIRSKDEYLFIGPQGQQMVVNCLPLLVTRPEVLQTDSTTASDSSASTDAAQTRGDPNSMHEVTKQPRRGTKAQRRFVLKKASSSENILTATNAVAPPPSKSKRSSEAEDILDENGRSNIRVFRDTWAHFNSSYPANCGMCVSDSVSPAPPTLFVTEPATPETTVRNVSLKEGSGEGGESGGGSGEGGESGGEEGVEMVHDGAQGDAEGTLKEEEERREGREEGGGGGGESGEENDGNRTQGLSDGGSDGEEGNEMRISYIENPEQMQTLQRSSGSVSFIGNVPRMMSICSPPPPSVVEDGGEGTDGGEEPSVGTVAVGSESDVRETSEHGERGENRESVERREIGDKATGGGRKDDEDQETVETEMEAGGVELNQNGVRDETGNPEKRDSFSETATLAHSTHPQVPSAPPQLHPPEHPPQPTSIPQPSASQQSVQLQRAVTPLPPPPMTFEPEFIERSGWLTKLSHRRGVFGDKWQKRYFVLHGSWIYYFKKYGDSIPRGAVRLHPGAWVKAISPGSARQSDAVVKTPPNAVISVVRCFGVHRPDNFAASLSGLLSQDGVADVFRSQTISVSNSVSCSRTFYMVAPSNDERDSWVEAIETNIRAHALSPSTLDTSCKELRNMLRAVQSAPPSSDLPSILSLLHSRTWELSRHGCRKL